MAGMREVMLAKLADSGLDGKDAKLLGFTAHDRAPQGIAPSLGGFTLPYFDTKGDDAGFYRYRYLVKPSGFAGLAKFQRYAQPKGSLNRLYFPPTFDFGPIVKDVSKPVIITEGELKAACAAKYGITCIALGGVWCFRAASKGLALLPCFDQVEWSGRVVTIMFDSDAANNPDIIRAENALARALLGLGAVPRIARLPSVPGLKKTGLDDYLVALGRDALLPVLKDSSDWQHTRELHALNEEVVYVKDPGLVIEVESLMRMHPKAFTEHAYAPRIYYQQVIGANGSVTLKERSAPKDWLKWKGRAEVPRTTYEPGAGRITNKGEFNVWSGWACEPKRGGIAPWDELLDYVFKGVPESRKWFEQWLAYPLQYPGVKLNQACLLWGTYEGTGKTLIGYTMQRIYGRNAVEISEEHLSGSFTGVLENKSFAMAAEMTGSDNKKAFADKFNSIVTQQEIHINQKFIPQYTVPDRCNWYLTSNHSNSMYIRAKNRRIFVHELQGAPREDEFYARYDTWYRSKEGPAALFEHLLRLDLAGFNPMGHALQTSAKADMIEGGMSDITRWATALRDDPDAVLRMGNHVLPHALYTSQDLLTIYDPDSRKMATVSTIARELKQVGILMAARSATISLRNGRARVWVVRDGWRYAALGVTAIAKMYEDERGMGHGKPKF